jgi:primary-amine oxidase
VIDDVAPPSASTHPLRPLDATEVETASALVRAAPQWEASTRFVYVTLVEPPKDAVLATGDGVPARLVKAVLRSPRSRETHEVLVSLDEGAVVSWQTVAGVQPSLTFEDFALADRALRADPRWRAAMRRRGVEDLDLAMIDAWPLGHWGPGDDPDRGRFVRPLTWVRSSPDDNGYARPVEGLIARVDLDSGEVVEVDDVDDVPLPVHSANYSAAGLADPANVPHFPAGPRTDLRPVDIVQPEGPSFELDGHHLR